MNLFPFEKYFPASRSRNLEEKAETFEYNFVRQVYIYFEQFGSITLRNPVK